MKTSGGSSIAGASGNYSMELMMVHGIIRQA